MAEGKLYIVVRANLPHGAQLAQAIHAARMFAHEHTAVEHEWFTQSNTIVVCRVDDELMLRKLHAQATDRQLRTSLFCEPDLGGSATAIALEPKAKKLCRGLKLAGG